MKTVFEAFANAAETAPDADFLVIPPMKGRSYCPEGRRFTYGEMYGQAQDLRERYKRAGFGRGHRIALLLENQPEFFIHYLAMNGLGIGVVPVNPDYVDRELRFLLTHSEADLVVTLPERISGLESAARDCDKRVRVLDAFDFPDTLSPAPRPTIGGRLGLTTECSVLYTSGTTGLPKGCVLTNEYYLTSGRSYVDICSRFGFAEQQERIYIALPLFHMGAQAMTATGAILTRNCLVLPDRFHPTAWWPDIYESQATVFNYIGLIMPLLLGLEPCKMERQHNIKLGIGAGVDPALHGRCEERYGIPLVETWGMTETGRLIAAVDEPRRIDTRAIGRVPFDGLEGRIVGDDNEELSRGEVGELVVRLSGDDPRKGFFSDYLKDDEATAEAWRGNWFHTGDAMWQGEDGMLYFVDRMKHMVRRSGENIPAAEVENVIAEHPAVKTVAVASVPDEMRDEEVFAFIVPRSSETPDAKLGEKIFRRCIEQMAYFKAPGWILFADSLPTTATNKVKKAELTAAGDPRQRPGVLDLRWMKKRTKR